EEIQAALFKIVKQIGEENFWKFFHLVEDEISKSGRDLCTVPLVNCLVERLHFQFDSTQHCSLSRNSKTKHQKEWFVLAGVVKIVVVWRAMARRLLTKNSTRPVGLKRIKAK